MSCTSFLDAPRESWADVCPGFHLAQLRRWVFHRKTFDFGAMTDLRKPMRDELASRFGSVLTGRVAAHTNSNDGTEKLLIAWADGNATESVLLRDDRDHRTGCISTQVGCAMGCVFCASGLDGFVRNLSRGEILEQILRLNALVPNGDRLTHLVIMGTGEPLLNLDALLAALDEATSPDGLNISARRVTVSTVGIPAGIAKLASSGRPYKLAVSLHAPDDATRSEIVPHNKQTGIASLVAAADSYAREVGRRVTMEYVLVGGVNDSESHAHALATLLAGRNYVVNLIPLNAIPDSPYRSARRSPPTASVHRFADVLKSRGVAVKIRFRKGDAIDAACGQLRRRSGEYTSYNSPKRSGTE
ncbi:MAG: 23S rRNA (adenine(2503)-C(2))-methyltransferase RlmN [Thermoguttaceae bacterium]